MILPEPPDIQQAEQSDKRKFAVLPFNAIWDRSINPFRFRVLAALAGFANRAGVCYVSNQRLAEQLQTTRPRVNVAVNALKRAGWIRQISKPVVGLRGATIQIMFEAGMRVDDAVAIASRGTSDDLRTEDQREKELVDMIADGGKQWTEQELKDNKERLAALLITAFKTPSDKPKMYEPEQSDTMGVKKIKQEIRSRMRQIKAETTTATETKVDVLKQEHKHKKLCLGSETGTGKNREKEQVVKKQEHKQQEQVDYIAIVVLFQNELFNGVKTENDLHMCMRLSEHGVTRSEIMRHITDVATDTVGIVSSRMLGT